MCFLFLLISHEDSLEVCLINKKDSPFTALMHWGTVPHSVNVKKPIITMLVMMGFCLSSIR